MFLRPSGRQITAAATSAGSDLPTALGASEIEPSFEQGDEGTAGTLECGGKRSATPPSESLPADAPCDMPCSHVAKAVSRYTCHRTPRRSAHASACRSTQANRKRARSTCSTFPRRTVRGWLIAPDFTFLSPQDASHRRKARKLRYPLSARSMSCTQSPDQTRHRTEWVCKHNQNLRR